MRNLRGAVSGTIHLVNLVHEEARRAYWHDTIDCGSDWDPTTCKGCEHYEQCKMQFAFSTTLKGVELLMDS